MPDIQEKTLSGLRVTRIGLGHYNVQSESDATKNYSVDLMDYGGLGSCTCDDQVFRRHPRWRKVRENHDSFRCKHIRFLRVHVLDQIIQFNLKKRIKQSNPK